MSYDPVTNVNFDARDKDCESKIPQPAFDLVSPSVDGWTDYPYRDYNGDYNPKKSDSLTDKTVQDYSPRDMNNEVRVVQDYKRCPIETCNP